MPAPAVRRSSRVAGAALCAGVLLIALSGLGPAGAPWSASTATTCLVVDDTDPAAESTRTEPCTLPGTVHGVRPTGRAGDELLAGLVLTFGGLGSLVGGRRRPGSAVGAGSRPSTLGEQTLLA